VDFRFKIASQAKRDVNSIWRYIAQDSSSNATFFFCDELLIAAESLKSFPHRHGNFAKRPNIRKVAYGAYLIFYKIDEAKRTVEILRFWHSAQDQRRLRLKEESLAAYSTSPSAVRSLSQR
jgi:plasmid stabilization system protein ParE